jgi:hypothetical protein
MLTVLADLVDLLILAVLFVPFVQVVLSDRLALLGLCRLLNKTNR